MRSFRTDRFIRDMSILPGDSAVFLDEIRKEVMLRGSMVQWKVVVAAAADVTDIATEVKSVVQICPEADKVVIVTNSHVADHEVERVLLSVDESARRKVIVQHLQGLLTPELCLRAAWPHVPHGGIVAVCIGKCQGAGIGPFEVPVSGGLFLQYVKIMWSFSGSFTGPFVTVISDTTSPWSNQVEPMVIMFDTATVESLGLPSSYQGGFRAWLDESRSQKMLYIKNCRMENNLLGKEVHAWEYPGSVPTVADSSTKAVQFTRFDQGVTALPEKFMSWQQATFVVLVILQGPEDKTTQPVFRDIAEVIDYGLRSLGLQSKIVYCRNLLTDQCFTEGNKIIVVAAHNLISFVTAEGQLAVLSHKVLPSNAVLYNFEHVPSQVMPTSSSRNQHGTFVTEDLLKVYSSGYMVWDYSEGNVKNLEKMGIKATLVPLGFSPTLKVKWFSGSETDEQKQIDVLFVGSPTPYRTQAVSKLRKAGVQVVYPNSGAYEAFGLELDALLSQAKIVLNLLSFDQDGEWKMTRLARMIANKRFVISEESGTIEEREAYSSGIVFVSPDRIAEACIYYLDHPKEREIIAERGQDIFEEKSEASLLEGPVEYLLQEKTCNADRCL